MSSSSTPDPIEVGVTSDIGAGLNLAKSGVDLTKQVDAEMNTPEMVKAAEEAKKQKALDDLAKAQASDDLEAERKAAE